MERRKLLASLGALLGGGSMRDLEPGPQKSPGISKQSTVSEVSAYAAKVRTVGTKPSAPNTAPIRTSESPLE